MRRDNKPTRSVGTASSLLCDTLAGVYSDPSRRTMSQVAIDRHGFIGRLWKWSARSELLAIAKIIRLNDLPISALGQKRTYAVQLSMSAMGHLADTAHRTGRHVSRVPIRAS